MRRSPVSLLAVVVLATAAGCIDRESAASAEESSELLSIVAGVDTGSLDGFEAIPGATVRYGEGALLVYRGDVPASVSIRLEAGPAWSLVSPEQITMMPREVAPIALDLTLAEGDPAPGPAKLSADVLREPAPPLPTR